MLVKGARVYWLLVVLLLLEAYPFLAQAEVDASLTLRTAQIAVEDWRYERRRL
jgi:hypothetical protein